MVSLILTAILAKSATGRKSGSVVKLPSHTEAARRYRFFRRIQVVMQR